MNFEELINVWNSAWPAGLIMLGLGVAFAVVLLVASRRLKVEVDPKVEQIQRALPGLDCGACGFAGCGQYAKEVSKNPELIDRCKPGGEAVSHQIAQILNLQISGSDIPERPIVHCRAHTKDKAYYAEYQDVTSCTAANALPNAQACTFGCLGYGDCVRACRFDALHIINGLAVVDYAKCTGCGACSGACPRNLIKMVPFKQENMMTVACSSMETGRVTRSMCKAGCIGCGLCAKQSDVFKVEDNLARVDYSSYEPTEQNKAAMDKCPPGVIVYRGRNAPEPRASKGASQKDAAGNKQVART